MTPEARDANKKVIAKLVAKCKFQNDATYVPISVAQTHEVAEAVPITQLIEMLLDYKCEDARDTANIAGLLITLGAALDIDRKATAALYRMRPGGTSCRDIDKRGSTGNFLQGRTALAGGGTSYPRRWFLQSDSKLTLQLHSFDLTIDDKTCCIRRTPHHMARACPARQSLAGPVADRPATAMSADIAGLLRELSAAQANESFAVRRLARSRYFVGRDASGCAAQLGRFPAMGVASLCDLPG